MFGDLDWLNASHGFITISWSSCFKFNTHVKCCWINELLIMSQCLLKMFPVWPENKLEIIRASHRPIDSVSQNFNSLSKPLLFQFFSGNSVISFIGLLPYSRDFVITILFFSASFRDFHNFLYGYKSPDTRSGRQTIWSWMHFDIRV